MVDEQVHWGQLKWYDRVRKMGFCVPENRGTDVLIHRNTYIGDVPLRKNLSWGQGLKIVYMLEPDRPIDRPKAAAWRFVK